MRQQLEARLSDLQHEFATGEQKLRELETQQARLRDTLLRIDGAMQVLHELLAAEESTRSQKPTQDPPERVVQMSSVGS